METLAHQRLKLAALAFLRSHGCQALATEVLCPISRFRVDAAGYADRIPLNTPPPTPSPATTPTAAPPLTSLPRSPRPHTPTLTRTILIECKQTRADFLRDTADTAELLRIRDALHRRRAEIERELIPDAEPHLRLSGSALFNDLEQWDYTRSRLHPYRRVLRRLRRIDAALYGHTKFSTITRYALADHLFIAAPVGLIQPHELPVGWGLLTTNAPDLFLPQHLFDAASPVPLAVSHPAPLHPALPARRARLLRNIAVAASRAICPPAPPAPRADTAEPASPAARSAPPDDLP